MRSIRNKLLLLLVVLGGINNRLPFCLTNSPSSFQRLMQKALEDLHLKICVVFIDDISVFANSFEQHVERLEQIFARLEQVHLKLNALKCSEFLQKRAGVCRSSCV